MALAAGEAGLTPSDAASDGCSGCWGFTRSLFCTGARHSGQAGLLCTGTPLYDIDRETNAVMPFQSTVALISLVVCSLAQASSKRWRRTGMSSRASRQPRSAVRTAEPAKQGAKGGNSAKHDVMAQLPLMSSSIMQNRSERRSCASGPGACKILDESHSLCNIDELIRY